MGEVLGEDGYPTGWPPPLRDLRRVVPIAQTVTVGGVVLMLLSVDDFPIGFTVRLRLLLADGHPIAERQRRQDAVFFVGFPPVPELELEVRDDRGRQYRDWGGGEQWGSRLEGRAEPIFTPALDPAARELRLMVAEVQWRTAAVWRGGAIVAVDRGPWVFAVAL